jgi:hypothetical protein
VKLTWTSVLFHPAAFGAGVAAAVTTGPVLSRFTTTVVEFVFPAPLVTVPETCCPLTSLLTTTGEEQFVTLEAPPLHAKLTVTLELFQPAALGAGVTVATIVGRVLSMLRVTVEVALVPALSVAVAVTACAAPSVVTTCAAGQEATPDNESEQT